MNDIQRRKSGTEDLSLKFVLTVFQAVWTLELGEFGGVLSEVSRKSPIFITFGWSLGVIMLLSVLFTGDQVPQERPGRRPNSKNVLSVQQNPNSKNDMVVLDILFWCLQVIAQQKSQKQACCEVQGPVVGPSDCSFR